MHTEASGPPEGPEFGEYTLLGPLGQSGRVIRAHHRVLGRAFAVERLAPALVAREADRARFERLARALTDLDHPHLARVFDTGVEGGVPYVAMALVDGESVAERAHARGPASIDEAVAMGGAVASALAHLHDAGLVHRAVNAANVRRDGDGRFVLVGLGASLLPDAPAIAPPAGGGGTPAEPASPEQIRGLTVPQSDQYGLGVVLFEALTGRPPFERGGAPGAFAERVLNEPAPRVRALRPDVPAWLDELVARCLEKRPQLRHPHMRALETALRGSGAAGAPVEAPPPLAERGALAPPPEPPPPAAAPTEAAVPEPPPAAAPARRPGVYAAPDPGAPRTGRPVAPPPARPAAGPAPRPVPEPPAPLPVPAGPRAPAARESAVREPAVREPAARPAAHPEVPGTQRRRPAPLVWALGLLALAALAYALATGRGDGRRAAAEPEPTGREVARSEADDAQSPPAGEDDGLVSPEPPSETGSDEPLPSAPPLVEPVDPPSEYTDEAPAATPPPALPSTAPPSTAPISEEHARELADAYLQSGVEADPARIVTMYGNLVRYYDRGALPIETVMRDKTAYFRRWTERSYERRSDVVVEQTPEGTKVRFDYVFRVARGDGRGVQGEAWTELTFRRGGGVIQIVRENGGVRRQGAL